MKSNYIASITLAFAMLLPLGAQAVPAAGAVLEDGREIAASMLTLPTAAEGTTVIQGCTACKKVVLQLSVDARFYIGNKEVSYVDLKRYLLANPKVSVTVVSPISKTVITRIRASGLLVQ